MLCVVFLRCCSGMEESHAWCNATPGVNSINVNSASPESNVGREVVGWQPCPVLMNVPTTTTANV